MPNPMLNDKAFEKAAGGTMTLPPPQDPRSASLAAEATAVTMNTTATTSSRSGAIVGDVMTMAGTITATGVLLALLLVGGVFGWNATTVDASGTVSLPGWLILVMFAALGCAMVGIFKPKLARIMAPLYALLEGAVLGGISKVYETQWDGIVIQAIGATVAVFMVVLVMYALRIVKVTNRFRSIVIAATFGLMLFYLVAMLFSLFGSTPSFINSPSGFGIAFSVLAAGLAAFNLFLNFDLIERGVQGQAPKYMEWYGAMGLTVTLVWLYLEMLRLLGKLRN